MVKHGGGGGGGGMVDLHTFTCIMHCSTLKGCNG